MHRNKRWLESCAVVMAMFGVYGVAAAGSWTVSGTPAKSRWNHQSVMLDGTVLSTGGWDETFWCISEAESFNPATGIWSRLTNMQTPRTNHAMVKLGGAYGVLVVGGPPESGPTAEVYNNGTWRPTGYLPEWRETSTATLLTDGNVFMAGGVDGTYPKETWLYNPARDQWSRSADLIFGREAHTATRLTDGSVLIVGGSRATPQPGQYYSKTLDFTEKYRNGQITDGGPLNIGRRNHTATLLTTGEVLVIGGYAEPSGVIATSPEIYNSGYWTTVRPPQFPRLDGHTATLLLDGRVLVVGGRTDWSNDFGSTAVEIYAPRTNTWELAPSMTYPRRGHTATLLPDGRVVVDGGSIFGPPVPTEIFDPQ